MYQNGAIRSDVLLKLDNANSGIHRVAWTMLVSNNKSAYFNIQRFKTAGVEFGEQFFFHANGSASIQYGNNTFANFTYPKGQWFDVELFVDLNTRRYTLVLNGTHRINWTNPNGSRSLGAIDFFAYGNTPLFYIDDACYEANLSHNPYGNSTNRGETEDDTKIEGTYQSNFDKAQQDVPNM